MDQYTRNRARGAAKSNHKKQANISTNIGTNIGTDISTEVIVAKGNKSNNIVEIDTVAERSFYDFYLNEHQNVMCRRLHFAGSSLGLLGLATAIKTGKPAPLFKGIVAGYACAWVGHLFFEKNKPATFKYPLQSFVSDFRMYSDILRGNLSLSDRKFDKIGRK